MGIKTGNQENDCGSAEPRVWDWITFFVALVVAVYLVHLTKALWMPFIQ
jgi:hypothetical protein